MASLKWKLWKDERQMIFYQTLGLYPRWCCFKRCYVWGKLRFHLRESLNQHGSTCYVCTFKTKFGAPNWLIIREDCASIVFRTIFWISHSLTPRATFTQVHTSQFETWVLPGYVWGQRGLCWCGRWLEQYRGTTRARYFDLSGTLEGANLVNGGHSADINLQWAPLSLGYGWAICDTFPKLSLELLTGDFSKFFTILCNFGSMFYFFGPPNKQN